MSYRSPGKRRRRLTIEPLELRTVLASAAAIISSDPSAALVSTAATAPSITLTGEATVLQNDIYRLQVSVQHSPASPVTLQIDWGDGRRDPFSDSRTTYLHTYAVIGNHMVAASLLNAKQQVIASATILIEVLAAEDKLVDASLQQGLQADWFNNTSGSGLPVLTRVDPVVDFDFGIGGPDPRTSLSDTFSARWTGALTPNVSGVYRLLVSSGATDGIRLTVGSVVGIDTLASPTAATQSMFIALTAQQPVILQLDYQAGIGASRVSLQWLPPGSYRGVIPSQMLSPPSVTSAATSAPQGSQGALVERYENSIAANLDDIRRQPSWIANQPNSATITTGPKLTIAPGATAGSEAGRMRGWLVAPESGQYRFAMFGNALAEWRLSSSKSVTDKEIVASLTTATTLAHPGDPSSPIYLRAGERYAFEVVYLFKTRTAQDRLGLLWSLPSAAVPNRLVSIPTASVSAPRPVVRLAADVSQTNESPVFGRGGLVTLQRSDDLGRALRVYYAIGGTATNGVDFRRLTGMATFLPGQRTIQIAIRPIEDASIEGSETVVLRLLSAANYQLGDESERQVTITIRGEVPSSSASYLVPLSRLSDSGDATFTPVTIQSASVPDRVATRVAVNSFQNEFDVSMRWQVTAPIKIGDAMLVSFYARMVSSPQPRGVMTTRLQLANAPFTGSQETFDISSEWQQYLFPFSAPRYFANGTASFDLRFGYLKQTIEVAAVKLFNFQRTIPVGQLPSTVFSYAGREATSAWREDVAARSMTVRNDPVVIDLPGIAPGTRVTISQAESEFRLGTAAAATWISPTAGSHYSLPSASRYRSMILELFNSVTDDGSQQWSTWLDQPTAAQELAQWAVTNDLALRGHSTLWGDINGFPTPALVQSRYQTLVANQGQAAANDYLMTQLSNWINTGSHVQLAQTRVGMTEPILTDLDVENHPLLFTDFVDQLGQGWIDQAIEQVRTLSRPDTKLFVNEDQVLSGEYNGFADPFYALLAAYLARGVPIDGVGFQGHFDSNHLPAIDGMIAKLDRFAQLGLEMQVTEFDVDQKYVDLQTQADFTRDFYRTVYANPDVNAITMWGFWQGEHWRSAANAGLFDAGFGIKPNGQAFVDFKQFSPVQLLVDQSGRIETTLPRGNYRLQIELPNGTATATFDVESGGTIQQVLLPTATFEHPKLDAVAGTTATNRLTLTAPLGFSLPLNATVSSSAGTLQTITTNTEYLWSLPIRLNTKPALVHVVIQYPSGTKLEVEFSLNVTAKASIGSAAIQTLSSAPR